MYDTKKEQSSGLSDYPLCLTHKCNCEGYNILICIHTLIFIFIRLLSHPRLIDRCLIDVHIPINLLL